MRNLLAALVLSLAAMPGWAALPAGSAAPDFVTNGAIGGKPFRLHLSQQLKRGPVVLYFFPKAFTQGCTLEARAFSAAMPEFRKAGARVIGMSSDDLATLQKFSVEECRSAFPVARATPDIARSYDVVLKAKPELTSRTSYVIGRDGRVVMVHDDMKWDEHVARTLAAVKKLRR